MPGALGVPNGMERFHSLATFVLSFVFSYGFFLSFSFLYFIFDYYYLSP